MALANTLSIFLQFKPDMSGLDRFVAGVRARLGQVNELNKSITNGAAAVNNALQAAAGYLAVGALKSYTSESLQARSAQAKLAQALQQTSQNSAAYRAELSAQASALQELTGLSDDTITGVQRQLVFAGAQRKDIADLTRLTLDFAAAKEIDAVGAAKAVGRALQGEGDELARYGVEVDLANDKVAALTKGLGKFRDQAATGFQALPKGIREFRTARKEAEQAAGDAILAVTDPFLEGLANGLRAGARRMREMTQEGSLLHSALKGIASTLGELAGNHLMKLALLAGALLSVRAGGYLASQAIAVLASSFLALTGQQFVQTVANVYSLSRGIGLLRALAVAGWAERLAAGFTLVAGALALLGVGSAVIKSVEQAQLDRLDREERIRSVIWDQTRLLQQQAGGIRTPTDVAAVQGEAQRRVEETTRRIAELEDKRAKLEEAVELQRRSGGEVSAAPLGLSSVETSELQTLLQALPMQLRTLERVNTPEWIAGRMDRNFQAGLTPDKPRSPDGRGRAEELTLKRDLLSIETAIGRAQLDEDFEEENRLTRMRDELRLKQELIGNDLTPEEHRAAAEAIRRRLDYEEQVRRKQHERTLAEREAFELETQALEAEAAGNSKRAEQLREQIKLKQYQQQLELSDPAITQARVNAERAITEEKRRQAALDNELGRRIAGVQSALLSVQQSPYLTDEQKRQVTAVTVDQITAAYERRIAVLEQLKQTASGDELQDIQTRIDGMRESIRGLQEQLTVAPTGIGQGMVAGLVDYLNQIPTLAMRARQSLLSIANALQTGIAGSLQGLILKTMTWRDALLNIGTTVITAVIGAFVNMAAQWIVQQIVMAVAGKAIQAAQLAALAPLALGTAALWAPAATAASIATFGAAAITGAAMAQAAIFGSVVGLATGGLFEGPGYVAGPGTATSDSINARLSNGEYVNRAASVDKFGVSFFDRLNAGILDLTALPSNVASSVAMPLATAAGSAAAGGSAAGTHGVVVPNVTVIQVQSEREATRIARRSRARGDIVQVVREELPKISRRGPG